MSTETRVRFDPSSPIPEAGVILPNVFPPANTHGYNGLLNLHDIIKGNVPRADDGRPKILGWLKVALGNVASADYIDPSLDADEQKQIREQPTRYTRDVNLHVDTTLEVPRSVNRIAHSNLGPPNFDWGRAFSFPRSESARSLVVTSPAETALAFSGRVEIDGDMVQAGGIHFPSGHLQGWVCLGEQQPATAEA